MMDNRYIFKTIVLLLIATGSEAIFFDYPKKALIDFLHSLKDKKEAAKKSHDDVHHYHLHYYPVPFSLDFDEHVKPQPHKLDFEHLHREELRSLGWTDHEYKHVPEPQLIRATPEHHETVSDEWLHHDHSHDSDGLTFEDQLDIAAIKHEIEHQSHHHKPAVVDHGHHQTHISLHLPLHQEIILHQPAAPKKEEKKLHPLTAFFQKLQHIKNSLFSSQEDEKSSSYHCEDKIEKPVATVSSKLRAANAYAIYFHPKNLRKF